MSDAPELKPCPFCGETKFLVAYNSPLKVAKGGGRVLKDQYQVRCKNNAVHAMVTMEVSSSDTADHALAAWNRLVVDPATIREAAICEAAAPATLESKMTKIDLHELVNLPYGEAHKRLEDAGHYRDADIKEYTVKVTGTYTAEEYTDTVTVKATSEERAFERAVNLVDYDVITSCAIVEEDDDE